jgi:hypothetical protein
MKCIADDTCSFIHEAYNVISGDMCTVLNTMRSTVEAVTNLVILPHTISPQACVLLNHVPSQGTSVCCLNESASSFQQYRFHSLQQISALLDYRLINLNPTS